MKEKYILNDLSMEELQQFFGMDDYNLKTIELAFNAKIKATGDIIEITSDANKIIFNLFDEMIKCITKTHNLDEFTMNQLIRQIQNNESRVPENAKFVTCYNGKVIKPQNYAQYAYLKLLEDKTIIFSMGSAGSGKTYLAVSYAINLLKLKKISKIIITRPIVEAGENLGFLPGEIKEKVDPYLIPIYDALNDILGAETTQKYIEKQIVEIAPLAYMRGRTLNDAFIILDEAQNSTSTQMKMFLTRLGYNAKMVVTGDETQIDLKDKVKSGIIHASKILKSIDEIGIIKFTSKDVVRNPLVSKIIEAYDKEDKNEATH